MTKPKTLFYAKRADISSSQLDKESMLLVSPINTNTDTNAYIWNLERW